MNTTSFPKSAQRLLLSVLVLSTVVFLYAPLAHAIFGMQITKSRFGHIMARSVVLTENGFPTYVEYDEAGEEVGEIAEASGFYQDAWVMSAARYQQIVENYRFIQSEHGETIARGAFVLSEEEFQSYDFVTRKGEPVTGTSRLMDATLSVFVRHKDEILIPEIDPILLQAPIDLNDVQDLEENIKSVLLSDQGKVLATSEHNIGFRVGFFKDEDDRPLRAHEHDRIYKGLENIGFSTFAGYVDGYGVSDERGFWKTEFLISPCPGFSYEASVSTFARLRYRRYNPRGSSHGSFYLERDSSHWCFGFGVHLAATPNLSAQMTAVNLIAIQAAQAVFVSPMNFYVDSAVISGQGELTNPAADGQGEDETVDVNGEPTSYHYEAPEDERVLQENFDFDGDEELDRTEFIEKVTVTIEDPETGQATQVERYRKTDQKTRLQGVYFSSGGQDPTLPPEDDRSQPDVIRLSDYKLDDKHQGLLANMNEEDLRETDLFVFRESNGMLVTYQKGLSEEDIRLYRDSGVDESQIYYQFLIRGPKSTVQKSDLSFSAFQSQTQINPALHEREADHLRAEEPIRVIAINRLTGYIGSVQAKFMDFDQQGLISVPVEKLKMRPPNLKVKAERKYTVEAGMTKDEDREYLIGYEG